MYEGLESSAPEHLPVAHKIANEVICLPIYSDLTVDIVNTIIKTLI